MMLSEEDFRRLSRSYIRHLQDPEEKFDGFTKLELEYIISISTGIVRGALNSLESNGLIESVESILFQLESAFT